MELRLPGLRQHGAPPPHVLLVGEAGHRRRVAVDGKLQGAAASDVEMLDGWLRLKSDPSRFVSVSEVMRRNGLPEITETFDDARLATFDVVDLLTVPVNLQAGRWR